MNSHDAASDRPHAVRLTPPQVELLTDLATSPQMYVRRHSRWGKTVGALVQRQLAVLAYPDYSNHGQDGYRITAAGRVEAARRGLIPDPDGGPPRG